ncbi:unnamed protein product [Urochloa humidicola]
MASAESLEAHPVAATPPSTDAPPPRPAAAAAVPAVRSPPQLARSAFLVVAALASASWYVEPFAAAAADLRVPWPVVVATLVVFAAAFCASVYLFGSVVLRRQPHAAAEAPQWKGVVGAGAAVVVGFAACLVAAGGFAYGYAPAPARR